MENNLSEEFSQIMEIPTQDISKEFLKEFARVEQQMSLLALDALQQTEAPKPLPMFLQFLASFQPATGNPNHPELDPFLQFLATFPLPPHLSTTLKPQDQVAVRAFVEGTFEFYRSIILGDGTLDEYKRFLQARRTGGPTAAGQSRGSG